MLDALAGRGEVGDGVVEVPLVEIRSLLVVLLVAEERRERRARGGDGGRGVLRRLRAHQDVADVPRVLHRQLLGFHVIVRVYVDPELERLLLGQGVVPVPVVRRGQAMKIHERVGTARGQSADAQGVFGVVIPRLPHRDLSGFPREITRGRRQGVHGEPGQVRRSLCRSDYRN